MIKDLSPLAKLVTVLTYLLLIGLVTVMGSGSEVNLDLSKPSIIIFYKVVQAIGVLLIFILPAILFSVFFTKEKLRYLQLHVFPKWKSLLLVMILMLAASPFINWTEQVNQQLTLPSFLSGLENWMKQSEEQLKELTEAFMKDQTVGGLILNLFVIAFMAALSEEIFFRGLLQKTLIEYTKSIHAGVWIAAILFSAFHMQFYGFIPRVLMGAVMGYFFAWSGSLWLNIWAHFVNNGAAVILAFFMARGSITEDADKLGANGNNDAMLTAISTIIVAVLLLVIHRLEMKRTESL